MRPDTVLVDVDGTIADQSHRERFLTESPKNWNAFFDACDKDAPVWAALHEEPDA